MREFREIGNEIFQLDCIRRCGHANQFFFLELGRQAITGAGNLWLQVEDMVISQNIHEALLRSVHAFVKRFRFLYTQVRCLSIAAPWSPWSVCLWCSSLFNPDRQVRFIFALLLKRGRSCRATRAFWNLCSRWNSGIREIFLCVCPEARWRRTAKSRDPMISGSGVALPSVDRHPRTLCQRERPAPVTEGAAVAPSSSNVFDVSEGGAGGRGWGQRPV